MASTDDQPAGPLPCSPCRGTGTVFSGAGGTQHTLPCPWCEGTGFQIPEHDAQAARRSQDEDSAPVPETD